MIELSNRINHQARALDGEIHTLEESEQILQHEVENGVQGLTYVKLSWAECKKLLALAEKKAADDVVALVVTDIMSTSVSFEQALTDIPSLESATAMLKPKLMQPHVTFAEGSEQPASAQSEATSQPKESATMGIKLPIPPVTLHSSFRLSSSFFNYFVFQLLSRLVAEVIIFL